MRTLLITLIVIPYSLFSQLRYPTGVVNVNTSAGGIVEQVQADVAPPKNALYLYEDWVPTVMVLRKDLGAIEKPVRFDILNNQIEIKEGTALKIIEDEFIESLNFKSPNGLGENSFFITNFTFEHPEKYPFGIYEVLTEGDINLLKQYGYVRLSPDYNPALDVGSRESRLEKTHTYYIMSKRIPIELPKSKNKILNLLDTYCQGAKQQAKQNGWNPKKEEELIKIINNCNN